MLGAQWRSNIIYICFKFFMTRFEYLFVGGFYLSFRPSCLHQKRSADRLPPLTSSRNYLPPLLLVARFAKNDIGGAAVVFSGLNALCHVSVTTTQPVQCVLCQQAAATHSQSHQRHTLLLTPNSKQESWLC